LKFISTSSEIFEIPKLTTYQAPKFEYSNTNEEHGFEREVFVRFAPGGLE
jgi:hypothetical protein